jgi:hypothetical protein
MWFNVLYFVLVNSVIKLQQLVKLSPIALNLAGGYVNTLTHIGKEPLWILKHDNIVCHAGALDKLSEVGVELLSHDFVVMDELLHARPTRVLTSILLSSTVWFDSGNGKTFMSHDNDGLVFETPFQIGTVSSLLRPA